MTVLRASMWVVVITLLAFTPAGDLEPDLTDLERTARSLGLATIFSLADQTLSGRGAVEQHLVTALSIPRGCDLAHEWLQRRASHAQKVAPDARSCAIAFRVRPGLRGRMRGFLNYEGCVVLRERRDADTRDVHLTVAPSVLARCSTPGPQTAATASS
jgi:hypothetical protein